MPHCISLYKAFLTFSSISYKLRKYDRSYVRAQLNNCVYVVTRVDSFQRVDRSISARRDVVLLLKDFTSLTKSVLSSRLVERRWLTAESRTTLTTKTTATVGHRRYHETAFKIIIVFAFISH